MPRSLFRVLQYWITVCYEQYYVEVCFLNLTIPALHTDFPLRSMVKVMVKVTLKVTATSSTLLFPLAS